MFLKFLMFLDNIGLKNFQKLCVSFIKFFRVVLGVFDIFYLSCEAVTSCSFVLFLLATLPLFLKLMHEREQFTLLASFRRCVGEDCASRTRSLRRHTFVASEGVSSCMHPAIYVQMLV